MKKDYFTALVEFIERHKPSLLRAKRFEIKPCFGAKAGYWDKSIFVSCGSFGIALRLPQKTIANLSNAGEGSPLKYFKNGHVKKEYVVISPKLLKNKTRMKYLLNVSLRFSKH